MFQPNVLVQQWIDALNTGDLAALALVFDETFVDHHPLPGQAAGVPGVRHAYDTLRTAFPDWQITGERVVAEQDTIVVYSTWRGTHQGEFLSVPPTGTAWKIPVVDLFRVANDKIVERWGVVDLFGLVQQLGILPPMGVAGGSTRLD